jgi:hypothetical protein
MYCPYTEYTDELQFEDLKAAGCRLQVADRLVEEALSFLSLSLMLRPTVCRSVGQSVLE